MFLIENWTLLKQQKKAVPFKRYRTPLVKRIFDVTFAGMALIVLSPLFYNHRYIITARIERSYLLLCTARRHRLSLFKFYKFRSMYVNADQKLKDLKHLNQYNNGAEAKKEDTSITNTIALCDKCKAAGTQCQSLMYADKMQWCEQQYRLHKKTESGSAFIKSRTILVSRKSATSSAT